MVYSERTQAELNKRARQSTRKKARYDAAGDHCRQQEQTKDDDFHIMLQFVDADF
jgi:hypothetical protein